MKNVQKKIKRHLSIVYKLSFVHKLKKCLKRISFNGSYEGIVVIGDLRHNLFYTILNSVFGVMLSMYGVKVYILYNDNQLPHIDAQRNLDVQPSSTHTSFIHIPVTSILFSIALKNWFSWIQQYYPRIQFFYYSQIISMRSFKEHSIETRYQRMQQGNISKYVDASHKRFFGGREFDCTNPAHVAYARKSIQNEVLSEIVANYVLSHIHPDVYINLDGIYSTSGIIADRMRNNGVQICLYQPNGFHNRSIFIGEMPYSICNISEQWDNFVAHIYNDKLAAAGRTFMANRLGHPTNDLSQDDKQWLVLLQEKKHSYRKLITLFPNLTWDGAIKERDILFNSLGNWMQETVEWAIEHEILLVIREHPQNPQIYNTFESSIALLKERMPHIVNYDNVVLIYGNEPISSYLLVKEVIDCSVVYNGTLGIEIPYMGYPVVIAAQSPYSHKGVGFEPATREDYFNYLLTIGRDTSPFVDSKETIQANALRAATYQFVYNCYYVPLMPTLKDFRKPDGYWQQWELSVEALDPRKNQEWKRTLERFLDSTDLEHHIC